MCYVVLVTDLSQKYAGTALLFLRMLDNPYSSLNIWMTKSQIMKLAGQKACMGKRIDTKRGLVGKHEGNKLG